MKNAATKEAALTPARAKSLLEGLNGGWTIARGRLEKEFGFEDFRGALEFTNKVGAEADRIDHHPDVALSWGRVKLSLWTHDAGGLTDKDFVLAARVDALKRR